MMGLEATAILLFIVSSPGIDRTVINEDAIEACIVLFRHHLAKNILPALNQVGHITAAATSGADGRKSKASATPTTTPSTSAKKRRRSSAASGDASIARDMRKIYKPMHKTIGLLVQIMERLDTLVQKIPLDDQPLLTISSGALISLELDPVVQTDVKIALSIHEAAIGVVTAIFRKYPRHRQIIIEDLFPIMLKLPSYKRSMRTYSVQPSSVLFPMGLQTLSQSLASTTETGAIQTITAIVLSLVQSSVVPPQILMEPGTEDENGGDPTNPAHLEVVSGLKACQSICDIFVAHLLARCSKKAEDGGASEFRPILANLIDDLLVVLLMPEYPAAEMLLMSITNRISMDLVTICNNTSKSTSVETTFLNTMLDAFGKICAAEARILKYHRERPVRIRSQTIQTVTEKCYCGKGELGASVECSRCHTKYHSLCMAMIQDTMPESWFCDACQLGRIVDFERLRNTNLGELGCSPELVDESYCMRRLLIDYLSVVSRKSGILGFQDAYEFHLARWLSELDQVQKQDRGSRTNIWPLLARLQELWDPRESSELNMSGENSLNGMLHCLSDEGRSRIMAHLAATQSQLLVSYRSQITLFVNQLIENKSSALLRRLALKAIEKVCILLS